MGLERTSSFIHVPYCTQVQEEREMWRQRQLELESYYEKADRQRRAPLLVRWDNRLKGFVNS